MESSHAMKWLYMKKNASTGQEEMVVNREVGEKILRPLGHSEALNLISIFGAARQGKSFLMNTLAGKENLFQISNSREPCTQGVDLASHTLTLPEFSRLDEVKEGRKWRPDRLSGVRVGFVDAEGQGDRDITYDSKLVSPVLLSSKCVIFNWKDSLQPDRILNLLAVLARAAAGIDNTVNEEKDGQNQSCAAVFGHLHIVFRDWHFIDGTPEKVYQDLFRRERGRSAEVSVRNQARTTLEESFESISVWLLPPPVEETKTLSEKLKKSMLQPRFLQEFAKFRQKLVEQLQFPMLFNGQRLTGKRLEQLVPALVEALNGDEVILPAPIYSSMLRAEADTEKRDFIRAFSTLCERAERGGPEDTEQLQKRLGERLSAMLEGLSSSLHSSLSPDVARQLVREARGECEALMRSLLLANNTRLARALRSAAEETLRELEALAEEEERHLPCPTEELDRRWREAVDQRLRALRELPRPSSSVPAMSGDRTGVASAGGGGSSGSHHAGVAVGAGAVGAGIGTDIGAAGSDESSAASDMEYHLGRVRDRGRRLLSRLLAANRRSAQAAGFESLRWRSEREKEIEREAEKVTTELLRRQAEACSTEEEEEEREEETDQREKHRKRAKTAGQESRRPVGLDELKRTVRARLEPLLAESPSLPSGALASAAEGSQHAQELRRALEEALKRSERRYLEAAHQRCLAVVRGLKSQTERRIHSAIEMALPLPEEELRRRFKDTEEEMKARAGRRLDGWTVLEKDAEWVGEAIAEFLLLKQSRIEEKNSRIELEKVTSVELRYFDQVKSAFETSLAKTVEDQLPLDERELQILLDSSIEDAINELLRLLPSQSRWKKGAEGEQELKRRFINDSKHLFASIRLRNRTAFSELREAELSQLAERQKQMLREKEKFAEEQQNKAQAIQQQAGHAISAAERRAQELERELERLRGEMALAQTQARELGEKAQREEEKRERERRKREAAERVAEEAAQAAERAAKMAERAAEEARKTEEKRQKEREFIREQQRRQQQALLLQQQQLELQQKQQLQDTPQEQAGRTQRRRRGPQPQSSAATLSTRTKASTEALKQEEDEMDISDEESRGSSSALAAGPPVSHRKSKRKRSESSDTAQENVNESELNKRSRTLRGSGRSQVKEEKPAEEELGRDEDKVAQTSSKRKTRGRPGTKAHSPAKAGAAGGGKVSLEEVRRAAQAEVERRAAERGAVLTKRGGGGSSRGKK